MKKNEPKIIVIQNCLAFHVFLITKNLLCDSNCNKLIQFARWPLTLLDPFIVKDYVAGCYDCKRKVIDVTKGLNPFWSFFQKSRTFGLGQTFWAETFWGIWGIFGRTISTHFGTVSLCFPLFNHYFYKNLSLYIQLPNIYLGLGFNLGCKKFEIKPSCVRSPWVSIKIEEISREKSRAFFF